MVASHLVPTGDLAYNPGMCPDWELNWQHFGLHPTLDPLSYTSQGEYRYFKSRAKGCEMGLDMKICFVCLDRGEIVEMWNENKL